MVLLITQNTPKDKALFFCLFLDEKRYLIVLGNWKNLNALVEESQRNVYPLAKRCEIKSENTITIYSNMPNPRCVSLAWVPDPSALSLAAMPDPSYVGMTNMSDLTNNKEDNYAL
jgi:hypothetical protein